MRCVVTIYDITGTRFVKTMLGTLDEVKLNLSHLRDKVLLEVDDNSFVNMRNVACMHVREVK